MLFLRESEQLQRGICCVAVGCNLRCEPVCAPPWPSQLRPQSLHEGDRVAHVAVQRGGGRPLNRAAHHVVKFAKSGVTAPPTVSAMTARHKGSSGEREAIRAAVQAALQGLAQGTSQGRKYMYDAGLHFPVRASLVCAGPTRKFP